MSRTACLDSKMCVATIRRATAKDAEVLGIIGPAAYAEVYGYLWDCPDAYSDQLRTFGPQASSHCSPDRKRAFGSVRRGAPS
jgi:hypothetical protein